MIRNARANRRGGATPHQTKRSKRNARANTQKASRAEQARPETAQKTAAAADTFERAAQAGTSGIDGAPRGVARARFNRGGESARGRFLRRFLGIRPAPHVQPRPSPSPAPVADPNRQRVTTPTPAPIKDTPPTITDPKPNRDPVPNQDPIPQPIPDPVPNGDPVTKPQPTEQLSGMEILTGWKQGSTGNCVTVAAIKAAQTRFGPELANAKDPSRGIFKSAVRTEAGGLKIEMRDGFKCTLSKSELDHAKSSSKFRLYKSKDEALLQNAQEVYAAAAKRAQVQGNDNFGPNRMSYARACKSLNDGENTQRISEQLGRVGLEDYTTRVKRSDLKDYDAALTYTPGHAYFVTDGKRDYYGKSGSLGRGGSYGWVLDPKK